MCKSPVAAESYGLPAAAEHRARDSPSFCLSRLDSITTGMCCSLRLVFSTRATKSNSTVTVELERGSDREREREKVFLIVFLRGNKVIRTRDGRPKNAIAFKFITRFGPDYCVLPKKNFSVSFAVASSLFYRWFIVDFAAGFALVY